MPRWRWLGLLCCRLGYHAFRRGLWGTIRCARCEARPTLNDFR